MGSIGLQQEKDIGYSINKESFELQENWMEMHVRESPFKQ
jgi:hypothetical protein